MPFHLCTFYVYDNAKILFTGKCIKKKISDLFIERVKQNIIKKTLSRSMSFSVKYKKN
jgi:hypothetical protein